MWTTSPGCGPTPARIRVAAALVSLDAGPADRRADRLFACLGLLGDGQLQEARLLRLTARVAPLPGIDHALAQIHRLRTRHDPTRSHLPPKQAPSHGKTDASDHCCEALAFDAGGLDKRNARTVTARATRAFFSEDRAQTATIVPRAAACQYFVGISPISYTINNSYRL